MRPTREIFPHLVALIVWQKAEMPIKNLAGIVALYLVACRVDGMTVRPRGGGAQRRKEREGEDRAQTVIVLRFYWVKWLWLRHGCSKYIMVPITLG